MASFYPSGVHIQVGANHGQIAAGDIHVHAAAPRALPPPPEREECRRCGACRWVDGGCYYCATKSPGASR